MFIHQPPDYICPFCLILDGIENEHVLTLQEHIIYRNTNTTASVSSHQFMQTGMNVLIVPNKHFENIYELPREFGNDLLEGKRLVALALKQTLQCEGISIRQHNEPAGSQDVWHYHEHITPRFKEDMLYKELGNNSKFLASITKRTEWALKLKNAISGLIG